MGFALSCVGARSGGAGICRFFETANPPNSVVVLKAISDLSFFTKLGFICWSWAVPTLGIFHELGINRRGRFNIPQWPLPSLCSCPGILLGKEIPALQSCFGRCQTPKPFSLGPGSCLWESLSQQEGLGAGGAQTDLLGGRNPQKGAGSGFPAPLHLC